MIAGGVMSYDYPTVKEYKFAGSNPAEVCGHVGASLSVCYTPFTSSCGNGQLEPGEDCDDTTPCCNNCKLAANAMCSYRTAPYCCDVNCNYKPSYTACVAQGEVICKTHYYGYASMRIAAAAATTTDAAIHP